MNKVFPPITSDEDRAPSALRRALVNRTMTRQGAVSLMDKPTFAHYRLITRLGQGGMGEVFLAEDLTLHRNVAIKFLLAGTEEGNLHNLIREARATACLDHPYICKVYEVGERDGQPFLAMEFVQGATLADRLRDGRLAPSEAVRLCVEIAEALHFAHTRGIIHRDLKPANVIVGVDGHVKVMDFGIAKRMPAPIAADALTVATSPSLNASGLLTGTLAYMSPEQLRGERIDQRSDIFALGILLWELMTGEHPFNRPSAIETAVAILNAQPPAVENRVSDVPERLAQVLRRSLEKDRERRYQSLDEMRRDLLAVAEPLSTRPGAGRQERRSRLLALGVLLGILAATGIAHWIRPLPFLLTERALAFKERDWIVISDFNNLTGDSVFDGSLRVALQVAIAQSQFVNVYSNDRVAAALRRMNRSAANRLDETLASEVAVRDNLRAVLAGDIAQVGTVYALTARIIDPHRGVTVLTESVTAKNKDEVLGELDKLATRVRTRLGESLARLDGQQHRPLPQATTSSLDALKMYAESVKVGARQDNAGDELLRQAISLDPDFAMAHAELGRRYYIAAERTTRELGEKHLSTALSLTSRLTLRERLLIQATAEDSRGNRRQAADAYTAYLAQYPDDASAWFRLAWTEMAGLQRYSEAVEHFKRYVALNPSATSGYVNLATAYSGLGDRASALSAYRKAFELAPDMLFGVFVNHEYGFTLVAEGKTDEAAAVFERMKREAAPANRARGFRSSAFLNMYRGHYGTAVADLREAILLDRTHRSGVSEYRDRLILQMALQAVGQPAAAKAEWVSIDQLARQLSLSPEWLWRPAQQMARAGREGDALRILALMKKTARDATAASAANRDTERDEAYLAFAQAEVELARGRAQTAIELLEKVNATLKIPETLESLAVALRSAGRVDEAMRRYEELLRQRPLGREAQELWFQTHLELGRLYERTGQAMKARALYESLLDKWKEADDNLVLLRNIRDSLRKLPV